MLTKLLTTSTCRIGHSSIRYFANSSLKNARQSWGNMKTAFRNSYTHVGKSLKERLFGPTTGKPFIYGTYAIIGASTFGLGMLGYYGLSQQDSLALASGLWPQYVRDRLKATYGYLFGSLVVTGLSSYAAFHVPMMLNFAARGGFLPFLVFMGAAIGTSAVCQSVDYQSNPALKHLTWLLHTATLGAFLCPLIFAGGPVLLKAALYTAGIVGGLTTIGYSAPSEKFLYMGGPLAMGLGFVIMANIGSIFLPPNTALGAGLYSVVLYGGLILFSAFILYETQKVANKAASFPRGEYYYTQSYGGYNGNMGQYNTPDIIKDI
ncbi:Growth hormone-inducible transmembrane protein [Strongyloides ratti]|uniref:Growth hormone-inducible transmembrane protein n=1 Tax=Strongyloides ratti TaxID=34506 RepID=A0A090LJN2_STRRB|nr:Growth hormone-inducible transmembrane protein [Strongyloides ratti]CEF67710.1 Growth hormone-inducible transmembrane protein [Strongyloides ratti]